MPSSLNFQLSESSSKDVLSIARSQELSKRKASSVVVGCKAQSWSPSVKVLSFMLKGKFDVGVSAEANLVKGRGNLVFNQGIQFPISEISQAFTMETEGGERLLHCGLPYQVCLPSLETLVKGQPLAGAFDLNSLPFSYVFAVHFGWCHPLSLNPME